MPRATSARSSPACAASARRAGRPPDVCSRPGGRRRHGRGPRPEPRARGRRDRRRGRSQRRACRAAGHRAPGDTGRARPLCQRSHFAAFPDRPGLSRRDRQSTTRRCGASHLDGPPQPGLSGADRHLAEERIDRVPRVSPRPPTWSLPRLLVAPIAERGMTISKQSATSSTPTADNRGCVPRLPILQGASRRAAPLFRSCSSPALAPRQGGDLDRPVDRSGLRLGARLG
jgi:hypothetical protein